MTKKIVKVYYQNNDIRRFTIQTNSSNFKEMLATCYKYIKNDSLDKSKPYVLYEDDEGEWVSCDSQEEYEECLFCIGDKNLKIRLTLPKIIHQTKSMWASNDFLSGEMDWEEKEGKKIGKLEQTRREIQRKKEEEEDERKEEKERRKKEIIREGKKIKEEKLKEQLAQEKLRLRKIEEERLKRLEQEKERLEKLEKEKKKVYKHLNTICDHCFTKEFTGKRFNCLDCGDYDLCEKCFNMNAKKVQALHNKTHVFKVFDLPEELCKEGDTRTVQLEEKKVVQKQEDTEIYPILKEETGEEKFAEQLGLLADMGFSDKPKLIKMLTENGGDVQSVVSACLSEFSI